MNKGMNWWRNSSKKKKMIVVAVAAAAAAMVVLILGSIIWIRKKNRGNMSKTEISVQEEIEELDADINSSKNSSQTQGMEIAKAAVS